MYFHQRYFLHFPQTPDWSVQSWFSFLWYFILRISEQESFSTWKAFKTVTVKVTSTINLNHHLMKASRVIAAMLLLMVIVMVTLYNKPWDSLKIWLQPHVLGGDDRDHLSPWLPQGAHCPPCRWSTIEAATGGSTRYHRRLCKIYGISSSGF